MTATTPAYLKLLAAHHPTAEVWEDETTITPRDLYPGEVTGVESSPSMLWNGFGTYESTPVPIYLVIFKSGYPDSSATYVWSLEPGTGTFYGWDPLHHVSHIEPINAYGGAASRNARLSIANRSDGGLVCVASLEPADSGTEIRMYVREPGAAWTAIGDVTSDFTVNPLTDYPADFGACPMLATGEDGAVYLAIVKPNLVLTDEYVNVSIYRASASASWATNPFESFMEGVLSEANIALAVLGLGFAIGGGQMLVTIESDTFVRQYAGVMPGQLTQIETATIGTNFVVKYLAGRFICAYRNASGYLRVKRLGSAFDTLSSATEIVVNGTWSPDTTSRPALWADDDGTLYLAASTTTLHVYESRDGGLTWASNISAFSWTFDTASADCTMWRGGACMVAASKAEISGTGYGNSLQSIDLGGWTSWAIPEETNANVYGYRDARAYPFASWVSLSDPDTAANVTVTESGGGTATKAFTSDLLFSITTSGGKAWKIEATDMDVAAPACKILALRTICEAVVSSVEHFVATGTYGLQINQGGTSLVLIDSATSSTIDTVTIPTGQYEVFALLNVVTGEYNILGRSDVATDIDARALTLLSTGMLSSGTVTAGAWSNVPTGREIEWRAFMGYVVWSSTVAVPYAPYGRAVSAAGTYTTNGITFAGEYGPAICGEAFVCAPASLWGVDKAALTETYPNLREHFSSADLGTPGTAATTAYLAFKVAEADADYLAPILASYVWSNAQQVALQVRRGGSWVSSGSAKNYTTAIGSGSGNTIHARYQTNTSAYAIEKDALAGGWIEVAGAVYTIAGNSSGLMASLGTKGTQIVIRTVEAVTTFSGVSFSIMPPSRAISNGPSSAWSGDGFGTVQGFRFVFSGLIPPEGYWKIKVAVGFADVLGLSHGLNTVRSSTPNAITNATRSGIMRRERIGPPTRTVEFSWQDIADPETPQTHGSLTATPDVITDPSGNILAVAGQTYGIVRAYIEDHGSTGRPVMYFPSHENTNSATDSQTEAGHGGAVVGMLSTDTWITEHAMGREEQHTDHLRGGTLKIVEVS